jgi:protein-S-isoprenylcysteine O-methyltransferase Ste14
MGDSRNGEVASVTEDLERRSPQSSRPLAGIIAYGALFAIVLPVLLGLWMWRLDSLLHLPSWDAHGVGGALVGLGIALMAAACVSLWADGHGLPMSPFPPEHLVTRGVYAGIADPIYVGAVLTCLGAALAIRSGAGLWIVTPVLALSAAAFVWGFERPQTIARFGPLPAPWLRIPPATDAAPVLRDRVSVLLIVLLPWLLLYEGVSRLSISQAAWSTYMRWELTMPVVPWTESLYGITYALVVVAAFVARRQRHLRQFALRGLGATFGIIPFYLLVPLVAPFKPVPNDTIWAGLMHLERFSDQRACSLPAFHVVWACIAAEVFVSAWPRLRWPAIATCLAIGASCVTTGMHSVLDVVAGFAAYATVTQGSRIWRWLCRQSERIANSWREWRVGPVRVMGHGAYAAVGAAAGAGIAVWLGGMENRWWLIGLTLGAEAGAGLWAQLVEGSPQLLRPYGYFGGMIAIIVLATAAGLFGRDPWLLLAAMAVGGCITQILGRFRCMVQGCCHGRPTQASWGIRHTHPRSRVVRLSDLGGKPIHPTALYSVLWMLFVFCALLRLWLLAVPLPFISGSYLLLVGLGRFVEEHFRGEPQTAEIRGLRLYQWIAIACVAGGAAMTTIAGHPAPPPQLPDASIWPPLAGLLLLTYVAFGVDVPGSNRRFSRLV